MKSILKDLRIKKEELKALKEKKEILENIIESNKAFFKTFEFKENKKEVTELRKAQRLLKNKLYKLNEKLNGLKSEIWSLNMSLEVSRQNKLVKCNIKEKNELKTNGLCFEEIIELEHNIQDIPGYNY